MKRKMTKVLMLAAALGVTFGIAKAADEIVASWLLQAQKGYMSVSKSVQSLKITMTGDAYNQAVTAYTSATTVVSADVATRGVSLFRNMSTTDCAVVTAVFLLRPGETVMGPLHTNAVTIGPYTNTSVSVESLILSR